MSFLPLPIRGLIYSFLNLNDLMCKISKLNYSERKYIVERKNGTERKLLINFDQIDKVNIEEFSYAISLTTKVILKIKRMDE